MYGHLLNVSAVSKDVYVNITETRELRVDFVPVDKQSDTLNSSISKNIEFLGLMYPLADANLITNIGNNIYLSNIGPTLDEEEKYSLLKNLFKSGRLSKKTDRVIGVVPQGWFALHGVSGGVTGYTGIEYGSNALKRASTKAAIIEEPYRHSGAHELAHTFGLCDEYNNLTWAFQDTNNFTTTNLCPNGDLDNDGSLDASCLDESKGCDTITIGDLIPWKQSYGDVSLFNFMGPSNDENKRWVSSSTYAHLLNQLSEPPSFLNTVKAILISGTVYADGSVNLDNSYILDEQIIDNESSYGSFSITLESDGGTSYSMSFEPSFIISEMGGGTRKVDVTAFVFVVPFSEEVNKVVVKEENVVKDEIVRTPNSPIVNVVSPVGGEVYYKDFMINWSASDADGDTLSYAVLLSNDNGVSWNTLAVDHEQTSFLVNVSYLDEGDKYLVKVLATDGINTGKDVSDSTFTVKRVALPRDIKIDSISKLESIKNDCKYKWWQWWKWLFNKKCKENKIIEHIIGKIDSSLKPYLWVDDLHLSEKHGKKVFTHEYKAVKYMMAKKKQVSEEAKTVFEEVITSLVSADKLITQTIIEDAKNTPVIDPKNQKKVNRELIAAEDEFYKAEQDITQGKFDKAILHYKKAWDHAQLAIKFAKKEKEKCWLWWKCKKEIKAEKEEKIGIIDAWGKFLDKVGGGYRER